MKRATETRLALLEKALRTPAAAFDGRRLTRPEIWKQLLDLFRWPALRFAGDGLCLVACPCPAPPHEVARLLTREWDTRGRPLFVLLTVAEIDALLRHHDRGHLAFGQGNGHAYFYTTPVLACWGDKHVVALGRALDTAMANWTRQTQQPCPPVGELDTWLRDMRGCLLSGGAFDPVFTI